jgi:hypothetical protein
MKWVDTLGNSSKIGMTQQNLLKALADIGAGEFDHINGQLIAHLEGTYRYLKAWSNREALCIAGLFHAVYTTDGYAHQLADLEHRDNIIKLIGAEAENIVYYYAACDRDYFYARIGRDKDFSYRNRFNDEESSLNPQLFCDLLELTIANEIEIVSNNKNFKEKQKDWYVELFARFKPYVSEKAFQCYQEVFA